MNLLLRKVLRVLNSILFCTLIRFIFLVWFSGRSIKIIHKKLENKKITIQYYFVDNLSGIGNGFFIDWLEIFIIDIIPVIYIIKGGFTFTEMETLIGQ
jgi:hypothetical protein